ncbi:MAG: phosphoribosylanthranilate isomerase [Opitutales bacterium]
MRPKVKVCGLTRPEDARAATRAGADYLGAIFYQRSPRYVNLDTLEDLVFAMPEGKRVMVDVAPEDMVLEDRIELGFDFYQLHFDLSVPVERIKGWSEITGVNRLWLAPRIPSGTAFPEKLLELADTFVLDNYKPDTFGGSGKAGGWDRFAKWKAAYPNKCFVLAGGLGPDNVVAAYAATKAEVLDLNSGVESAPGIKDQAKLSRAIHAVRNLK